MMFQTFAMRQSLHVHSRLIIFLTRLVLLPASLYVGSVSVMAQTRDYAVSTGQDYYAPRTDKALLEALHNVELYHLGPGRTEVARKRYHAALAEFEFILRYFPNHPQALSLLSDICPKAQEYCKAAEDWLKKGIDRNPQIATTHLLYAIHLHRTKRPKEAVASYRRALELEPESVNVHYNLGLAYTELQQYDLANQHAQKSYQLGAFTPGLRNRLQKVGKWNPNAVPAGDAPVVSDKPTQAEKIP